MPNLVRGATKCQMTKYQGRWGVGVGDAGGMRAGKEVGEVHRSGLEVARCEDLVEIYASVCFEVEETRSDFYIGSRASILPGPGCRLFNKRTLTTGGGKYSTTIVNHPKN